MTDIKELNDEELEKVAGGFGYTIGNPKPNGYAFRTSPSSPEVFKIYSLVGYVNDLYGYEYTVDKYYDGEYMGHFNGCNFYDYDIDSYAKNYGLPE